MNLRVMKISDSDRVKLFDSYSSLDVPIVRAATFYSLGLLGGTATQYLARQYNVKERRQRSINDLDFLVSAQNKENIELFKNVLKREGFEPIKMGDSEYMLNYENKKEGVEVDVLISWDSSVNSHLIKVGGILVVEPCYLFVQKLQRMSSGLSNKNATDRQDINTLFDIIQARGEIEKLQDMIASEVSEISEEWLNSLLVE